MVDACRTHGCKYWDTRARVHVRRCAHHSSSPSTQEYLQHPILSTAQNEGLGWEGQTPAMTASPPAPIPGPFVRGKVFNLGTQLLLHCPWGFGAWWGKGLRLVPLPQRPQPH